MRHDCNFFVFLQDNRDLLDIRILLSLFSFPENEDTTSQLTLPCLIQSLLDLTNFTVGRQHPQGSIYAFECKYLLVLILHTAHSGISVNLCTHLPYSVPSVPTSIGPQQCSLLAGPVESSRLNEGSES